MSFLRIFAFVSLTSISSALALESEPIGFYTRGSIYSSAELPEFGLGFLKIFRLRDRAYGARELVELIQTASAELRREFPRGDRLQVGDLSDWNGGPLSGHGSHQNGLDADFSYLRRDHREYDPNTHGPRGYEENFVVNGALTANFDVQRNWAILRNLVRGGKVGRVFVDPAIKAAFCSAAATLDPTSSTPFRTEVLRRLRPYPNHADHFHLRIRCPTDSLKCVPQAEPPAGSGCGNLQSLTIREHD